MLAVHPNSPVTIQQGESLSLLEVITFSTLASPRVSLITLQRSSVAFF